MPRVLLPRSGTIGGGIARRYLLEGATVIAPTRSTSSHGKLLTALEGAPLDKLLAPSFDNATAAGNAELAAYVKGKGFAGSLFQVVVIAGGMLPPALPTQASAENLGHIVDVKFGPLLWMTKELLPLLAPDGSFAVISGGLGELPMATMMPQFVTTAMANAATSAFVAALQGERKAAGQHILEVRLCAMVGNDVGPWGPKASPDSFAKVMLRIATGADKSAGVVRVEAGDLVA